MGRKKESYKGKEKPYVFQKRENNRFKGQKEKVMVARKSQREVEPLRTDRG